MALETALASELGISLDEISLSFDPETNNVTYDIPTDTAAKAVNVRDTIDTNEVSDAINKALGTDLNVSSIIPDDKITSTVDIQVDTDESTVDIDAAEEIVSTNLSDKYNIAQTSNFLFNFNLSKWFVMFIKQYLLRLKSRTGQSLVQRVLLIWERT